MCYTYDELSREIKTNTVDLTTNEQTIKAKNAADNGFVKFAVDVWGRIYDRLNKLKIW